ncbi:DUF4271 domain-containing protein [Pseudoprevotella muciniphila]|uniref:DUF4271 domain-containing protein n=1 Tax=Pseudoprevotella muciniphila TaxID=2133944 RepID=A0A5P8E6U6_9BACT|nr:DUF4271 domain-containing protein [Pseudoprevotella muciniphila]QFQ12658.1 DUF4271 domain-containing protein [Pseudoprevotella muciniphila]
MPETPQQIQALSVADTSAVDSLAAASLQQTDSVNQTAINDSLVAARAEAARQDSLLKVRQSMAIDGTPVPYNFGSDTLITGTLIISAFISIWAVARMWNYLVRTFNDFFYDIRQRGNVQMLSGDEDGNSNFWILAIHSSLLLAMFFACYTQRIHPDIFNDKLPYLTIIIAMMVCLAFYFVRWLAYGFINNVFFEKWQVAKWNGTLSLATFIGSLIILALLLLYVFFNLPFRPISITFILLLAVGRIVLCYKAYATFFTYKGGFLHLILYFCTLEITPLLVLWKMLQVAAI